MKNRQEMEQWWNNLLTVDRREALAALKASIEHWERLASGTAGPDEGITCDDCALCAVYERPESIPDDEKCCGCPVAAQSGADYCANTPWIRVANADNYHGRDSRLFREAAARQLDYLRSLLPKEAA